MKLSYDTQRKRLLAGGLDQQIKFFELFNDDEGAMQLRLTYKIKLPQAVFTMAISPCGNHYVVGLVDGSLIIKSKELEAYQEEVDGEMKMIMNAYQPHFKARTAKDYKYFYRGQYNVMPETEDLIAAMGSKKQRLQPYE